MKRFPSANFAALFICIGAGQSNAAANGAADANAPVPQTLYQSPFMGYRELGADQATPWRDANDTVKNIGGWRAYAKEAADAAKAASKAKTALPPMPLVPATSDAPAAKPSAPQHKHGG